jgi:hypothetical protein
VRLLAAQLLRHHQHLRDKPVVVARVGQPGHSMAARGDRAAAFGIVSGQHRGSGRPWKRRGSEVRDEAARGSVRRRTLPPLQRFCEVLQERVASGMGGLWACVAAYVSWHFPSNLCAQDMALLGSAISGAAKGLREATVEGKGMESHSQVTLGWCLFALEGLAEAAWGIPRHCRFALVLASPFVMVCQDHRSACHYLCACVNTDVLRPFWLGSGEASQLRFALGRAVSTGCWAAAMRCCCRETFPSATEEVPLPAHALAAALDWNAMAELAESVVVQEAEKGSAALHAVSCCRAVHLRRVLIEHHLESLPLCSTHFWHTVDELVVWQHPSCICYCPCHGSNSLRCLIVEPLGDVLSKQRHQM